jgi:predicted nucleic acid-binding protein
MNGNKLLLDTNIVLYFLDGDTTLIPILENKTLYLSIISEIELLGYNGFQKDELKQVKAFIRYCDVVNIDSVIKKEAIKIRRQHKIKLPDAVIAATSESHDIPLITADTGIKKAELSNTIFYDIS